MNLFRTAQLQRDIDVANLVKRAPRIPLRIHYQLLGILMSQMLKMPSVDAMTADDAHLGLRPLRQAHAQLAQLRLAVPAGVVLDRADPMAPGRAAEEDPQHAQAGHVGAQAAERRRRA